MPERGDAQHDDAGDNGPGELAPEVRGRGLAPGDERPDAGQSSSRRPSGTFTLLKNGGPTVILVPRTASDRIGNRVPHSTEKATPTQQQLLKRNAASRELTIDRVRFGFQRGHRV